jgi:hypothetical protein
MSKAFPTRHTATERHAGAGIATHAKLMTAHHELANAVEAEAAKDADGLTVWQQQQLRTWAQAQDDADECMQAMLGCGAIRNRAQWRQYAHNCYCQARASVARVRELIAPTLAQVADRFSLSARIKPVPPGVKTAPNVLATCHASNAPGLSPAAMTWQVIRLQ